MNAVSIFLRLTEWGHYIAYYDNKILVLQKLNRIKNTNFTEYLISESRKYTKKTAAGQRVFKDYLPTGVHSVYRILTNIQNTKAWQGGKS